MLFYKSSSELSLMTIALRDLAWLSPGNAFLNTELFAQEKLILWTLWKYSTADILNHTDRWVQKEWWERLGAQLHKMGADFQNNLSCLGIF